MATIGTVALLTGSAIVVDASGAQRTLLLGDSIESGDTIVVPNGATVELQLANGNLVQVGPEQTVTFTQELSDAILYDLVDPTNNAVSQATIQSLIQAIQTNANIDDIIDALANERAEVNEGVTINQQGHNFVDLLRIDDVLNQFDYAYDVASREFLDNNPLAQDRDVQLGDGLSNAVYLPRIDQDLNAFDFEYRTPITAFESRRYDTIRQGNDPDYLANLTPAPVGPGNLLPIASFSTTPGTEDAVNATLNLTGTDPDGTIVSVTVAALPPATQGILYLADGATPVLAGAPLTPAQATGLIFIPALNFNGTVNVPFVVTDDGGATSNLLVAQVSIIAVNDAPIANNDNVAVTEDTPVSGNVLTNDTDVDGDALSVTQFTVDTDGDLIPETYTAGTTAVIVGVGSIVINTNGTYTFTPAPNYVGAIPEVVYTLSDGALTDTATLNLGPVTAVNDNPDAIDDTVAATEDTPITIAVASLLANDTDVDGNPLTVTSVQAPTNGTVTLNAGNIIFTPNANYNGPATFTYTISDGQTGTDSATVTLNIATVNDAPAGADRTISTNEDTAYTFSAADFGFTDLNDSPANSLQSVVITSIPPGSTLRLSGFAVTAGQEISLANIPNLVYTPPLNSTASSSFTFQVRDNGGIANGGVDLDQSPNTISINITPVNDNPDAVPDTVSTPVDTPVILTPLNNDTDVEGAALTLTSIGGTAVTPGTPQTIPVSNGVVNISAAGVITFTPNSGFSGTSIIPYSISDGAGGTDSANITLNVSPNVPPQGADASRTIVEDNNYTLISADFGYTDADVGQILNAVRIDTLPTVGTLLLNGFPITTAGQTISVADIDAGNLIFQPAANGNGSPYSNFTFSVQDDLGGFDTVPNTFTFNVTPVNDAPDAIDNTVTATEDTPATISTASLLTNDTDIDGEAVTFVSAQNPTNGSVSVNAGNVIFTPNANYNGPATFTYTIRDAAGLTDTATVTVNVGAVNDAPDAIDNTVTATEDTPATISTAS
ncbi:MAG: retention module-containing protein, partial [Methylotenera sp.]|nr:retention module-containing protein [Methylotenera sp.]